MTLRSSRRVEPALVRIAPKGSSVHGRTGVLKDFIPSMFKRRLLLLLALAGAAFVPLVGQMARLTLLQAAQARTEAEARLVRRQWTPTVRGTILDRKDRVLAQDRPSYDVTIDYQVLSGEWARERATRLVRRAAGSRWRDLSPSERAYRIEVVRGLCEAHLDRSWDALAQAAGVSRGELDQKRKDIVERVERMYQTIVDRRRAEELVALRGRDQPISIADQEAIERRATQPIHEQGIPHVLLSRVADSVAFSVRLLEDQTVPLVPAEQAPPSDVAFEGIDEIDMIPGLRVIDAGDRDYPYENVTVELDGTTLPSPVRTPGIVDVRVEGVATHILGWVRDQVQKEDVDQRREAIRTSEAFSRRVLTQAGQDRGAYQTIDRVGHVGIERSFESELRGLRGLRETKLDTGAESVLAAEPGKPVRLTIDINLQARIHAAMTPELGLARVQPWHHQDSAYMPEGTVLNGAAVVLDVDTGDILAMVSTPSFSRQRMREHPESVFADQVNVPFLNRAIAKSYTPGSVVKAMVLAEAITRGNYTSDQRIACTGHLLPNQPNLYRCWIYKRFGTTHSAFLGHDLSGPEAIMTSCNIFFFTLGRRLGAEGITETFRDFGVGEGFGLGIGDEFPGQIGARGKDGKLAVRPEDAIQMAIGQGPVVWTPLHAASAYATLARGGVVVPPRITLDAAPGVTRPKGREIRLNPEGVAESLEGLKLSVNDKNGAGNHLSIPNAGGAREELIFNVPGVMVWGKTGTADAPDQKYDPDGEGPKGSEVARAGDHSWFVVLVGPQGDRPRYAISVVMDYAGSGAKVSGPICNQIIHALVAEGYLSPSGIGGAS